MLVRPMIGSWEVPRIERIRVSESRRLAVLPVVGLSGDLHQDLGRGALAVQIEGSLYGDEPRDGFLAELRGKFNDGEPVDFVADIVHEAELEQVLIEAFDVAESAHEAGEFRYRIVLAEFTEPPEPPSPGFGLDPDLGLDIDLGLDLLDLPAILGAVPEIGELLAPVEEAAAGLKDALAGAGSVLSPLDDLLGSD